MVSAQSSGAQVELAQLWVLVHTVEHPPQWASSPRVSMQAPPHALKPASAAQVGAPQRPAAQTPDAQSPPAAQRACSAQRVGQLPPQSVSLSPGEITPSEQVPTSQVPPRQLLPLGHSTPSHATSRQPPLTHSQPAGQLIAPHPSGTHEPPKQPEPLGQTTPTHALSVQRMRWQTCEGEQSALAQSAAKQVPVTQLCDAEQAVAHAPQCASSL